MTTDCWPHVKASRQFHVLALEGPDPYAQAGGIASRITELPQTLAAFGEHCIPSHRRV
jgi:hypothetical protein